MMDNVFKCFTYGKPLRRSSYSPQKESSENSQDEKLHIKLKRRRRRHHRRKIRNKSNIAKSKSSEGVSEGVSEAVSVFDDATGSVGVTVILMQYLKLNKSLSQSHSTICTDFIIQLLICQTAISEGSMRCDMICKKQLKWKYLDTEVQIMKSSSHDLIIFLEMKNKSEKSIKESSEVNTEDKSNVKLEFIAEFKKNMDIEGLTQIYNKRFKSKSKKRKGKKKKPKDKKKKHKRNELNSIKETNEKASEKGDANKAGDGKEKAFLNVDTNQDIH